jgi:hypothetical protein
LQEGRCQLKGCRTKGKKGRLEPHDITSHCLYRERHQCSQAEVAEKSWGRKRGLTDLARRSDIVIVADQNHRGSSEFRPSYTYTSSLLTTYYAALSIHKPLSRSHETIQVAIATAATIMSVACPSKSEGASTRKAKCERWIAV